MMIQNPILKGFNPDPSIIRVGEDYYIATSTFEWFPGVHIHHSRDLINWELIARPLNRLSQLDLRGVPDSGGVWAPCLSYDHGTFFLVFSNVFSFQGIWKDTPNYLVTTNDIHGDWSDPVFLSSSGFDGSLFHDADGRKYYLSMLVDHRKGRFFGGIIMQKYDAVNQCLIGPVHQIFDGSDLGLTEGPHIYKKGDYYYLLTAEGGTEYGHAVSIARATEVTGPYALHPENPILTARDHPDAPFQKTGHADLVQTPDDEWYIVFLTGRPLTIHGRCTLGRETGIEEIIWNEDDWPVLKSGGKLAREYVQAPTSFVESPKRKSDHEAFSVSGLNIHFQSLRIPITEEWCSLKTRPGYLRIYGQESLSSLHRQSLIARRLQSFHVEVQTCIDFYPESFQQMAGLVCYYNTYHWIYLYIMGGPDGARGLHLSICDKYEITEILFEPIPLPNDADISLEMKWERADILFSYAIDGHNWVNVGPVLDGSILSDDYVRDDTHRYRPAFTGAFIGMSCQDLSGKRKHADFKYWKYKEV